MRVQAEIESTGGCKERVVRGRREETAGDLRRGTMRAGHLRGSPLHAKLS